MCAEARRFHLARRTADSPMGSANHIVSSKWTTHKVDQAPNTEAFANLPQLGSGRRKETTQQSIPAKPLHPFMPALGAAIHPLEDPGQLRRDRGIALAKGNRISRKAAKGANK